MLRTEHTKTEGCFSSSRKELPGSVKITSTQPIMIHVTTVVAGLMRYDGCIGKEHTDGELGMCRLELQFSTCLWHTCLVPGTDPAE